GRLVEHQVDLPGHQILHGQGGAAVGHELETRARLFLKEDAGDMRHGAGTCRACRRLVRVRLEPGNQFPQVLCGHAILGDDQLRIACDQYNRLEILQHVVLEGVACSVHDMRAEVAYDDGVAIGCGTCGAADRDAAGRTSYVFDNDRLTKCGPHSLADN